MKLYLISCAAGKRGGDKAYPARDLYTSPLFVESRAWVEARFDAKQHDRVYVLSALHGALAWETPLEAYDQRLHDKTEKGLRDWQQSVAATLSCRLDSAIKEGLIGAHDTVQIVVLAGAKYVEGWPRLLASGPAPFASPVPFIIVEPLLGMGIGTRLKYLKDALKETPEPTYATA